jgi:hypothetical protein
MVLHRPVEPAGVIGNWEFRCSDILRMWTSRDLAAMRCRVSLVVREFLKKIPTQRKFVWNNGRRPPPDNAGTSMKFRAPKELLQIYLQTSPVPLIESSFASSNES